MFESIAVNFMGKMYAEVEPLKKKIEEALKGLIPNVKERMIVLLCYEGIKIISKDDF